MNSNHGRSFTEPFSVMCDALKRLTRLTHLDDVEHTKHRDQIIAEGIARSTARGFQPLNGTARALHIAPEVSAWVMMHGATLLVWGIGEMPPRIEHINPANDQTMIVFGALRNIGREKREVIDFSDWHEGEVCETTLDGVKVRMLRVANSIEVCEQQA